jgi:hypothetical protein
MIYWFRNLPAKDMNFTDWKPFIQNEWFRNRFMILVYFLMGLLITFSISFHVWDSKNIVIEFLIFVIVFFVHELLHFITVFWKEDISLTHSGIYFWLNTNAVLPKKRFLLFMSLPIIILSGVTFGISFFVKNEIKELLLFVCWVNLIIASSDIINSVLVIIKPNKSEFCRGLYRIKK